MNTAAIPLIEFRNVYKIYHMGDSEVHAADGISMKIYQGEFVAIVGQSGSGKSTCMNIIGCLDVPTAGDQYLLAGASTSASMDDDDLADIRNQTLGFIFQQYNLLPKLNLLENVEVSMMYAGAGPAMKGWSGPGPCWSGWAWGTKCGHKPSQLSGGQQQRVSIARALANQPLGDLGRRTHRRPGFPHWPGCAGHLLQELHAGGQHHRAHHPRQQHRPSRPSASSAWKTAGWCTTAPPTRREAVVTPRTAGAAKVARAHEHFSNPWRMAMKNILSSKARTAADHAGHHHRRGRRHGHRGPGQRHEGLHGWTASESLGTDT